VRVVNFGMRQMLRTAAALVALAVAAPQAGLAEPEPESAADRQRELIESIDHEESQNGVTSEQLIGPLTALALFYQEQGDHGPAIAAIDRTRQLVRMHYGLHTLDEARLIQLSIVSETALGDAEAVWGLEQELLEFVRRNPSTPETVPMLGAIADRRLDVLQQYEDGGWPPEIVLGCYYNRRPVYDNDVRDAVAAELLTERLSSPVDRTTVDVPYTGRCRSGHRADIVRGLSMEAWSYYDEAAQRLVAQDGYSTDALREIEMKLVRSSWQYGYYSVGKRSLRRLAEHDAADRMDTLVQLADWELMFADNRRWTGRTDSVTGMYEQTYQQLRTEGADQASIDAFFAPKLPVVMPAFLPNPLASEQTPESVGFVDVAFDITSEGESDNIEILDTTTNATRAAEKDLVRLIKYGSFRPRSADGNFEDSSRVVVRYYLDGGDGS
jgi:hypothetical protein